MTWHPHAGTSDRWKRPWKPADRSGPPRPNRALGALWALRLGIDWVDLPDGSVRLGGMSEPLTVGEACYVLQLKLKP